MTELTRRHEVRDPLLHVLQRDVETRTDHTALVHTAQQVHDDFAGTTVIYDFEFTDVTYDETISKIV